MSRYADLIEATQAYRQFLLGDELVSVSDVRERAGRTWPEDTETASRIAAYLALPGSTPEDVVSYHHARSFLPLDSRFPALTDEYPTRAEIEGSLGQRVWLGQTFYLSDGNYFGGSAAIITLNTQGQSQPYVVPQGYSLALTGFSTSSGGLRYAGGYSYTWKLLTPGTTATYIAGMTGDFNFHDYRRTYSNPLSVWRQGESVQMYVDYNNVTTQGAFVYAAGFLFRN
ncbi:hypothetical protein IHN63_00420 [Deinococcus sp. 6YEL10]|uniref:hypothetical protein n=1 Tax=Deinococcus sp. 6YEL10 TaxID=2745870 RepID=UPI001E5237D5|nr:hypothetical protein [Deinococcus sp. 6YEL10]MCD0159763.1 hypothetical protein [Deinococcus sp. 6YEL10]